MKNTTYDVAILGSGLGGSTLGAILARAGHSVLLLEADAHPRFAVGESTIPEFSARARVMAGVFDLPELAWLGSFQQLRRRVSPASGIKRSFSFLWHGDGEPLDWSRSCQFQTLPYPLGPDSHFYRPEVDQFLTALAVRHGVEYHEKTRVLDVETDPDGATIRTSDGGKTTREWRARFVADGTGYRSVLAEKHGLRATPDSDAGFPQTDSRTIFTHMVGVGRTERVHPAPGRAALPCPTDQGTCHHIFDGGWFWIIPFDNHADSANPLTSVGLTLDRRKHPETGADPEEEFRSFVARFPTVARQLEGARAVRRWVGTGRMQYASTAVAGERWMLLPHASGFIDPLFSGGLAITLAGVEAVARELLAALPEDDFSVPRFARIQADTRANIQTHDTMVRCAYTSFRSFDLFNAWFRVWALGSYYSSAGLIRLHLNHRMQPKAGWLDRSGEDFYRRTGGSGDPRLVGLYRDAAALITAFDRGALTDREAADQIFSLLAACDWVPPDFRIADPAHRTVVPFTILPMTKIIFWGRRHAPADMRERYFQVAPTIYAEMLGAFAREAAQGAGAFARVFLGAHFTRVRL